MLSKRIIIESKSNEYPYYYDNFFMDQHGFHHRFYESAQDYQLWQQHQQQQSQRREVSSIDSSEGTTHYGGASDEDEYADDYDNYEKDNVTSDDGTNLTLINALTGSNNNQFHTKRNEHNTINGIDNNCNSLIMTTTTTTTTAAAAAVAPSVSSSSSSPPLLSPQHHQQQQQQQPHQGVVVSSLQTSINRIQLTPMRNVIQNPSRFWQIVNNHANRSIDNNNAAANAAAIGRVQTRFDPSGTIYAMSHNTVESFIQKYEGNGRSTSVEKFMTGDCMLLEFLKRSTFHDDMTITRDACLGLISDTRYPIDTVMHKLKNFSMENLRSYYWALAETHQGGMIRRMTECRAQVTGLNDTNRQVRFNDWPDMHLYMTEFLTYSLCRRQLMDKTLVCVDHDNIVPDMSQDDMDFINSHWQSLIWDSRSCVMQNRSNTATTTSAATVNTANMSSAQHQQQPPPPPSASSTLPKTFEELNHLNVRLTEIYSDLLTKIIAQSSTMGFVQFTESFVPSQSSKRDFNDSRNDNDQNDVEMSKCRGLSNFLTRIGYKSRFDQCSSISISSAGGITPMSALSMSLDGTLHYHHYGAPKLWLIVPKRYTRELHDLVSKHLEFSLNTGCSNPLSHGTYILDPMYLQNNNIDYVVYVQHQGTVMVIRENIYAQSISCGFNVTESIGISSYKHDFCQEYLPAQVCSCEMRKITVPYDHVDLKYKLVKRPNWQKLYDSTRYRCRMKKCDFQTKDRREFNSHMHSHVKSTFSKCEECSKTFKSAFFLERHMATTHVSKECIFCDHDFCYSSKLATHMLKVHSFEMSPKIILDPMWRKAYLSMKPFVKTTSMEVILQNLSTLQNQIIAGTATTTTTAAAAAANSRDTITTASASNLIKKQQQQSQAVSKQQKSTTTIKKKISSTKEQLVVKKPFTCKDCGEGYATRYNLRRHQTIYVDKCVRNRSLMINQRISSSLSPSSESSSASSSSSSSLPSSPSSF